MRIRSLLLLAAVTVVSPAQAGLVKCKGVDGKVIYSDEPCKDVGGREEKKFSRTELKGNQMRMRPRPAQGDGSAPEFGSGSNYQGAAPDKAGGARPTPVK